MGVLEVGLDAFDRVEDEAATQELESQPVELGTEARASPKCTAS